MTVGSAEVDHRIESGSAPTEQDLVRQLTLSTQALRLCRVAMDEVLLVLGGYGLREGSGFERRCRDVAAMPLHINAHPDRVYDRAGRLLVGAATARRF